jgi:two-component system OmpR family response regulator
MRILIVEDNQKLAEAVRKGLQQEGYAVDVARDGAAGLLQLRALDGVYSAVILDLMLPEVDGVSLCRSLRAEGRSVPVLMVTARDTVKDRVAGLDAGADDYLTKPFAFEELAARVRALLRRPPERLSLVLDEGGVTLSPSTREVSVGGRRVVLTSKEFALLELLMRHPGQVLSRQQIMDHLWDDESQGNSNIVEVHVKNVRKKLMEAGKDDSIETVRGAGYRFAV